MYVERDQKKLKKKKNRVNSSESESLHGMANLQRFKLLATQCGVAPSPTRSPRTSPVIHLRRRRTTLRSILLGRRWPEKTPATAAKEEKAPLEVSNKRRNSLEELFYSPALEIQGRGSPKRHVEEKASSDLIGMRSPRTSWLGFRQRTLLLRRIWRPVLVTIPE